MDNKFDGVKGINDLVAMGADVVMEFHNLVVAELEAETISREILKRRYGLTLGDLSKYLYSDGNYTKRGKYFIAGKKRKRTIRKDANKDDVPVLGEFTAEDVRILKKLISEKKDEAVRSIANEELVSGEKVSKQCIYFVGGVDEQFKNYCDTHKRFNKSEHIMLALLEYMENHK